MCHYVNTGLNIVLEFTLEDLIFEKKFRCDGVKPPRALSISVMSGETGSGRIAGVDSGPPPPLKNSWNKPCIGTCILFEYARKSRYCTNWYLHGTYHRHWIVNNSWEGYPFLPITILRTIQDQQKWIWIIARVRRYESYRSDYADIINFITLVLFINSRECIYQGIDIKCYFYLYLLKINQWLLYNKIRGMCK